MEQEIINAPLILSAKVESLGVLTSNAKELQKKVKNQLEIYKQKVYTDENIDEAKKDAAAINSFQKTINDERISLERQFMVPFEEFKGVINEIVKDSKEIYLLISKNVKDYDEAKRNAKLVEIKKLWASFDFDKVSFEKIEVESWKNSTTSMKKIKEEMTKIIEKINGDLALIDRVDAEDRNYLKAKYLINLNIQKVLADYDAEKAVIANLKAKADEEKALKAKLEEASAPVQEEASIEVKSSVDEQEPLYKRVIEVVGTKAQFEELAREMKRIGLEINVIGKGEK